MHVNLNFMVFGIGITTSQIADLLLVGSLSILLLRRLLISVKSQRQMALDVKQAQEVQQVILPMRRQQVSGFAIDTEYRPAREVGGDFFQIIPDSADGSLLIVAGDVAGKGLRAGMLVALLVGAIRTAVAFNREPARLLRELNQRLLGRGDAQATCLALRIDPDGSATLANAGHMPPYLNGRQMPMEGALPLGMVEEAEFSVMRFKLSASDRLVLLSDGIVEATDLEGKLFGFERVLELMRTSISAAEVADAAQKFGQEDDISVISLTRNELLSPVMA
jgi:serine phosphatase RsbU (regulator of sigma subunit)